MEFGFQSKGICCSSCPSLCSVEVLGNGYNSTIRCGVGNEANGCFSSSLSGKNNTASSCYSSVINGLINTGFAPSSSVFSGNYNEVGNKIISIDPSNAIYADYSSECNFIFFSCEYDINLTNCCAFYIDQSFTINCSYLGTFSGYCVWINCSDFTSLDGQSGLLRVLKEPNSDVEKSSSSTISNGCLNQIPNSKKTIIENGFCNTIIDLNEQPSIYYAECLTISNGYGANIVATGDAIQCENVILNGWGSNISNYTRIGNSDTYLSTIINGTNYISSCRNYIENGILSCSNGFRNTTINGCETSVFKNSFFEPSGNTILNGCRNFITCSSFYTTLLNGRSISVKNRATILNGSGVDNNLLISSFDGQGNEAIFSNFQFCTTASFNISGGVNMGLYYPLINGNTPSYVSSGTLYSNVDGCCYVHTAFSGQVTGSEKKNDNSTNILGGYSHGASNIGTIATSGCYITCPTYFANTSAISGDFQVIGGGFGNLSCCCGNLLNTIFGGQSNSISRGVGVPLNSCLSTIIGGCQNNIARSVKSFIGGGIYNVLTNCENTGGNVILGGVGGNTQSGTWSLGNFRFVTSPATPIYKSNYNFLGSGFQNKVNGSFNIILGGCTNNIVCSTANDSTFNVIAGSNNIITCSSVNKTVMLGNNNCAVCQVENSSSLGNCSVLCHVKNSSILNAGRYAQFNSACNDIGFVNTYIGSGPATLSGSNLFRISNQNYTSTLPKQYISNSALMSGIGNCLQFSGTPASSPDVTPYNTIISNNVILNSCSSCILTESELQSCNSVILGGRKHSIVAYTPVASVQDCSSASGYTSAWFEKAENTAFIGGGDCNTMSYYNEFIITNSGDYCQTASYRWSNPVILGGKCQGGVISNNRGSFNEFLGGGAFNIGLNRRATVMFGGVLNSIDCATAWNVVSQNFTANLGPTSLINSGEYNFFGGGLCNFVTSSSNNNNVLSHYVSFGGLANCVKIFNNNGCSSDCIEYSSIFGGALNSLCNNTTTLGGKISNKHIIGFNLTFLADYTNDYTMINNLLINNIPTSSAGAIQCQLYVDSATCKLKIKL